MKRILILIAIGLLMSSVASAAQGGGGESTKKKAKKSSGTSSANTTPPRPPAPPAKPKAPTTASVMVNSTLPNVTVAINGRAAGTTDSNGYLVVGLLKPGVYTVSATKPGYQAEKMDVTLSAGQSEALNFELKPITQSLTISSTPPESEIYIDEVLRGRTDASGNARVADIPVGEHRVTIRKPRYHEAIFPLSLTSENEGKISANLELAIGFLTVTTNAPNPSIEISGLGQFDKPVSKFECQPGTYFVTISSPLYLTSRREVNVSAGREAALSLNLEADTEARNRLASGALEAYSSRQYDSAINVAKTLLSTDPGHVQALTVVAQSYFMKDDFESFFKFGSQAIKAGGSLEFSLKHHHEFYASSSMHQVRVVLTATTLTYDPQLAPGMLCPNPAFTVSLAILGAAEVSGNRDNEIYLRLTFVDPNKPKKSTTMRFGDRESYFVKARKNAAGGLVSYVGENMVSRREAYPAMGFIAGLLNRAKAEMKAGIESSMAVNKTPEVILEAGSSDPDAGTNAALPTIESIVKANIKALGNPARVTTAILRGTFSVTVGGNIVTGAYEEYFKGREKYFQMFNRESAGAVLEMGYDGTSAWSKANKEKPTPMSAPEIASVKRDLALSFLTEVKEFNDIYPVARLKGKGKLGEREVYVLETTPSAGRLETLYFDTTTGLLMRKDANYGDPENKGKMMTTTIFYDEYKDVGGMQIPVAWRQIVPTLTISVKISDTKFDVPIDDAKFVKPKK